MSKPQPQAALVDQRLAKALSHPMRAHILGILNERVASPNEIAETLGERLPNVSYHVRALLDLECIELVSTAPRRGAVEHYYRALKRPFFSDRDWKRLPRSARQAMSDIALQMVWDDVSAAIKAGTFEARPDRYLIRAPLELDEEGWRELNGALGKLYREAERIAARSAKRLKKEAEAEPLSTRLVLLHFPAAETDGKGRGKGRREARRSARAAQ